MKVGVDGGAFGPDGRGAGDLTQQVERDHPVEARDIAQEGQGVGGALGRQIAPDSLDIGVAPDAAIDRARHYVEAGADMIFAEALGTLEEYARFTREVNVPVLANITEFGRTPLFTIDQLRGAGVRLVLYPLSAFRAMSAAAEAVYAAIRQQGTQASVIDRMQTRAQLYEVLNYHSYEAKLDALFARESKTEDAS